MEPFRVDYEVRDMLGVVRFTTDHQPLAERWADEHCAPRFPLLVERVKIYRELVCTATREPQDIAL
jgi:hypothetical protein